MHTRPQEQLKSFFPAGTQELVERYNKCIVLQGDYVEKWYVKLLTVTSIKAVKCILPLLFDSPSYMMTYCLIQLTLLTKKTTHTHTHTHTHLTRNYISSHIYQNFITTIFIHSYSVLKARLGRNHSPVM